MFIIKISSLQHYHLLLSTVVDSVVAIPGDMTDIKMIFNPCPHVWSMLSVTVAAVSHMHSLSLLLWPGRQGSSQNPIGKN